MLMTHWGKPKNIFHDKFAPIRNHLKVNLTWLVLRKYLLINRMELMSNSSFANQFYKTMKHLRVSWRTSSTSETRIGLLAARATGCFCRRAREIFAVNKCLINSIQKLNFNILNIFLTANPETYALNPALNSMFIPTHVQSLKTKFLSSFHWRTICSSSTNYSVIYRKLTYAIFVGIEKFIPNSIQKSSRSSIQTTSGS